MPVDTPERRAAFERRLREVLGQIRDESIRRHYQDEVGERLRQLFSRGGQQQPRARGRQQGTRQGGFGGEKKFGERGRMPPEPMVASPSLARSRLYLSKDLSRSGESPREAFILLGLAANAEMLAQLGEEIVELDFGGREALRFGQMLLDVVASGEVTAEALARRQSSAHIAAAREALSAAIRPGDARRLIQDADPTQLSDSIRQAILLHRRARTLHSDLKAAEAALAEDMSEANFAWVRDIKARLESLDGTEADPDDVN
jgi:DNA primase